MNVERKKTLKILSIASAFMAFLPALAYYLFDFKSVHADKGLLKKSEIKVLLTITGLAAISHVGVSFFGSSLGLGAGFLMVSIFIHLTTIAALVLFYLACKHSHTEPSESLN